MFLFFLSIDKYAYFCLYNNLMPYFSFINIYSLSKCTKFIFFFINVFINAKAKPCN